ncbi:MAG: membrane dipeptidase, partial [Chloroflexota bacterium]
MTVEPIPPIVDAHNDLLMELNFRRAEPTPFANYWLSNLRSGGVKLQVCPVDTAELELLPERALRQGLEQVMACKRAVRENVEQVTLVQT